MASLKLLYRQEVTDGASRAVGKTLQLGKGRGAVLVLCEGKGQMPQAAQAAQKALTTIEQQFGSGDSQLNIATSNVLASIVWINKDKVTVAGNGEVVCLHPQIGVHTLQEGLYNGDVILLAPTGLYKALTVQQIMNVVISNPTDLKAIHASLSEIMKQKQEVLPTILMAFVSTGCKEPQSEVQEKGEESQTASPKSIVWLIAAAVMTIATIVLLCLF